MNKNEKYHPTTQLIRMGKYFWYKWVKLLKFLHLQEAQKFNLLDELSGPLVHVKIFRPSQQFFSNVGNLGLVFLCLTCKGDKNLDSPVSLQVSNNEQQNTDHQYSVTFKTQPVFGSPRTLPGPDS